MPRSQVGSRRTSTGWLAAFIDRPVLADGGALRDCSAFSAEIGNEYLTQIESVGQDWFVELSARDGPVSVAFGQLSAQMPQLTVGQHFDGQPVSRCLRAARFGYRRRVERASRISMSGR
ncbi:hypothetical protein [Mycobacteroides abscessus]|uniref:hypothetical protein n=1 Tax=Mycobacteroides abscessus TaxID=36809 RepID=UPI000DDAB1B2|nr:hypothetical protein [Mycobacteroides abscessus]